MSKNFVDINNLNRFWAKAKEYVDDKINNASTPDLNYVYIQSDHENTYTISQDNYYDFGIVSELNIELDKYSNTEVYEYNFQFRTGHVIPNLNILNINICGSLERYCIHRVKIIGNVANISKIETPQYFCIEQIGDDSCNIDFNLIDSCEISIDGKDWMTIPAGTTGVGISPSISRYIYVRASITPGSTGIGSIISSNPHKISGNILSLLYGDDFIGKNDNIEIGTYTFSQLFKGSIGLCDASGLELCSVLTSSCFKESFMNCSSLKYTPHIKINSAAGLYNYQNSFRNCTNLKKITIISISEKGLLTWNNTFSGIPTSGTVYFNEGFAGSSTSFKVPTGWDAKFIKGTDRKIQCLTFEVLDDNTTFSFTPAASGTGDIQYKIFGPAANVVNSWTTLSSGASTPAIPAGCKIVWEGNRRLSTTSSTNIFVGTFSSTGRYNVEGNPLSLVNTSIENIDISSYPYIFSKLFINNNYLISAKNLILSATTLSDYCYSSMFQNCTSLTEAPDLPATTLTPYCYSSMFHNCTSLTEAPDLPATTLTPYCYDSMFFGCKLLNSINILATDISDTTSLKDWISLSSDDSKAIRFMGKHYSISESDLKIRSSEPWVVYDKVINVEMKDPRLKQYLTFEAIDDCEFGFTPESMNGMLYYSINDGLSWEGNNQDMWDGGYTVSVSSGSKIMWKSDAEITGQMGRFTSTGKYNVSGNIMSLLYKDDFKNQISLKNIGLVFGALFAESLVVDASNLVLPATEISFGCYYGMFMGNSEMTKSPEILPAEILTESCYNAMFTGNSNMVTAPILPAEILTESCYYCIFSDCSSLTSITILATDISASDCLGYWLSGAASSGTIYKNSATTFPSGEDGIPTGWTTVNV